MRRVFVVLIALLCFGWTLANSGDIKSPNSKELLGVWLHPAKRASVSIETSGSKYYMVTRYPDAGEQSDSLKKSGKKFLSTVHEGDFYVITSDGKLEIRDQFGVVYTLNKSDSIRATATQINTDIAVHNAEEAAKPIKRTNYNIESGAIIGKDVNLLILDFMVARIKNMGYRCESVSAVREMFFSSGYVIFCNEYYHHYDLENKGGTWKVTVK